ncbi:MAG: hypothetical protein GQE15_42880 [Archangiaceae bacterium]|nr:hypothetical protein [Archangiaceae bacterium]
MNEHPSFLALDRHALGASTPEVAAHVGACSVCRAHLDAVSVAAPIPPRVLGLRPSAPWWKQRWFQVLLPVAAALVMVVLISARPADELRAKGPPTAIAWVKRGDDVSQWKGAPLTVGDSVRFQVAPEGLSRVTVIDGTTRTVLYEALVKETTMTPAWTLDGTPGGDVVWVVLSNDVVTPAIIEACDGVAVWCRRFDLRAGSR